MDFCHRPCLPRWVAMFDRSGEFTIYDLPAPKEWFILKSSRWYSVSARDAPAVTRSGGHRPRPCPTVSTSHRDGMVRGGAALRQ